MYHFIIYEITNKLNGKFYIGKHKTKNLDDGYMGSGKVLKNAIKKHGIENFSKKILFTFDNEDDMNAKEVELVVLNEQSYNLCPGGHGGFGYINSNDIPKFRNKKHTDKTKEKISKALLGNTHMCKKEPWNKGKTNLYTKEHLEKLKKPRPNFVKEKIANTLKNKEVPSYICPHCKQQGKGSIMKRWHFDNCAVVRLGVDSAFQADGEGSTPFNRSNLP